MVAVNQVVPNATLYEFIAQETPGCTIGPNAFSVSEIVKGKKIIVFGLPGAFTPTCSAQHVPGYVEHIDALKAKGVDEVWCVSVNDAFVMGAWGDNQKAANKVRMMADGSGEWTKALGLELDLVARGLGIRSQRYVMVLDNGVVKHIAVEAAGKFEVSSAQAVMAHI
jgi:peroxiredoxin (alkyl hydroperoxide reductase subunit C)